MKFHTVEYQKPGADRANREWFTSNVAAVQRTRALSKEFKELGSGYGEVEIKVEDIDVPSDKKGLLEFLNKTSTVVC